MHDIAVVQFQFGVRSINRFESPTDDLHQLFDALNGYGPHALLRNRIQLSFSSGDYIRVDGTWFKCEPVGWSEVNVVDVFNIIDTLIG